MPGEARGPLGSGTEGEISSSAGVARGLQGSLSRPGSGGAAVCIEPLMGPPKVDRGVDTSLGGLIVSEAAGAALIVSEPPRDAGSDRGEGITNAGAETELKEAPVGAGT